MGSLLRKAAHRGSGESFALALLERFTSKVPSIPLQGQAHASPSTSHDIFLLEPVSARELDVLRLLADGLSNKEIADQLFIGVGTVKWYATTIYSKLNVGSRTQAVARAQELGLLS